MAKVLRPILIVEDEPADAYYCRFVLEKHFENPVYAVSNCREASDFLECKKEWSARDNTPPALMLLDVKIPGLPTHELIAKYKSKDGKNVPMWLLTQYPEDVLVEKALNAGAEMLFTKPLDP